MIKTRIKEIVNYSPLKLSLYVLFMMFVVFGIAELNKLLFPNSNFIIYLESILSIIPISLLVMYYWLIGERFIIKSGEQGMRIEKLFKASIILFLVSFSINMLIPFKSENLIILGTTMVVIFASFSTMIWVITKLFIQLEEGKDNQTIIIASTEYKLFWVIIIGIWFLDGRIKKCLES